MTDSTANIKITITEQFVSETGRIQSDRVFDQVYDALESLQTLPEMGSKHVPEFVKSRYGTTARKLIVPSFDIFYTYDPQEQLIVVLALVHQRKAR